MGSINSAQTQHPHIVNNSNTKKPCNSNILCQFSTQKDLAILFGSELSVKQITMDWNVT